MKGANLKSFLKAGIRRRHQPAVAAALIVSGVLTAAVAGWDIQNGAAAQPPAPVAAQPAASRASAADAKIHKTSDGKRHADATPGMRP